MTDIDRFLRRRRALRRLRGGFVSSLDETTAHLEHLHVLLEWAGIGRSLQAFCAKLASDFTALEARGLELHEENAELDALLPRALANLDMLVALVGNTFSEEIREAVASLREHLADEPVSSAA